MQYRVTVKNGAGDLITNTVNALDRLDALRVNFIELTLGKDKVTSETCGGPYNVISINEVH